MPLERALAISSHAMRLAAHSGLVFGDRVAPLLHRLPPQQNFLLRGVQFALRGARLDTRCIQVALCRLRTARVTRAVLQLSQAAGSLAHWLARAALQKISLRSGPVLAPFCAPGCQHTRTSLVQVIAVFVVCIRTRTAQLFSQAIRQRALWCLCTWDSQVKITVVRMHQTARCTCHCCCESTHAVHTRSDSPV